MSAKTPQSALAIGRVPPSLGQLGWLAALAVGVVLASVLWWREQYLAVSAAVPVHALPAYHLIQAEDLTPRAYLPITIPSNVVVRSDELVGRFTVSSVGAGRLVTRDQLIEAPAETRLVDSVVVELPNADASLRSMLQPGETIDLVFSAGPAGEPPLTIADAVVVIVPSWVAIPANRLNDYASSVGARRLVLARRPG